MQSRGELWAVLLLLLCSLSEAAQLSHSHSHGSLSRHSRSPAAPPSNSSLHYSSVELAGQAALYSLVTSAGFICAVLIAWFILTRLSPGSRPVGSFGKFMIMLEGKHRLHQLIEFLFLTCSFRRFAAVDAIPEAMVIAEATAGNRMTIAFAFSIFSLNMANTMATALDFLATKPERVLHRLLLALIFFSVGSLSFSISSTVFSSFLEHLADGTYTWLHLLPMLMGVTIGALLIWLLMMVEERLHAKELAKAAQGEDVQMNEDVLGPMRLSLEREENHLELARQAYYESDEYKEKVIAYYVDRVARIKQLIASLESVNSLRESLHLPITQDAREVVEDSIYDQLGHMEEKYLLAPQKGPKQESLHRRAIRLLMIMIGLVFWAVLLTFAFTPLFAYLDQGTFSGYVNSFAEGLSGGAFLATISSTMIPRIQQDAYRSHWSRFAFRSVGMVSFICGLIFAVLLETTGK